MVQCSQHVAETLSALMSMRKKTPNPIVERNTVLILQW